jgi:hypothetical protein
VPSPRSGEANVAVRRFSTVRAASVAVKVAAVAVLLYLVVKILGGP